MSTLAKTYDGPKRVLDTAASICLLVLLSPIILAVAIYVLLTLGTPIFFVQDRLGKDGKVFSIYKFRTMRLTSRGELNDFEESRLENAGRRLRRTSLDELPQLLNVLKGDMSLVGPRPLLVSYKNFYNEEQARRMEVRPGMTGLAQVRGRNLLSWPERFSLDVEYVENRSLGLDTLILVKTLHAVFTRRGISPNGGDTVVPFSKSSQGRQLPG